MRSSFFLTAVPILLESGIASPFNSHKKTFSVNVIGKSLNQGYDGHFAVRKAMAKYGTPIADTLQKRHHQSSSQSSTAQPTVTASVIADSVSNDLEYLSPVLVGQTTMRLDFDTGSSDLWVFSNQLPPDQTQGHATYDISNSSTGTLMEGFTWGISYGDKSGAQGLVFADKVVIGGATVTSQAVEAATSISSEFISETSDGLLGLGFGAFNSIRPQKQPTFFENIMQSLEQPLFTVALKENASGTYDFGFIDPNKFIAPIEYAMVDDSRGYWEYTVTGFAVGNDVSLTPVQHQSIADTGSTILFLQPQVVEAYYAQVNGAQNDPSQNGFVFPCNSELPDLTFQLSVGFTVTLPGQFVNRGLSSTGSGSCYGGIQVSVRNDISFWGDVFFKSHFVVFDSSSPPSIGFAKQAT